MPTVVLSENERLKLERDEARKERDYYMALYVKVANRCKELEEQIGLPVARDGYRSWLDE